MTEQAKRGTSVRTEPYGYGYGGEESCTHCNGEGLCWDGADPLGNCPDEPHRCHACGGSGDREDQVVF